MKGLIEEVKDEGMSLVLTVRVYLREGPKGHHQDATVEYHRECIDYLQENIRIKSFHIGDVVIHQEIVPDEYHQIKRHETAIAGIAASKCGGSK
jgi:hypothetical protein